MGPILYNTVFRQTRYRSKEEDFLRLNNCSLYCIVGPTLEPLPLIQRAKNFKVLIKDFMEFITMRLIFLKKISGGNEEDFLGLNIFLLFRHVPLTQ